MAGNDNDNETKLVIIDQIVPYACPLDSSSSSDSPSPSPFDSNHTDVQSKPASNRLTNGHAHSTPTLAGNTDTSAVANTGTKGERAGSGKGKGTERRFTKGYRHPNAPKPLLANYGIVNSVVYDMDIHVSLSISTSSSSSFPNLSLFPLYDYHPRTHFPFFAHTTSTTLSRFDSIRSHPILSTER